MDGKVSCKSCNNSVTPKLWHHNTRSKIKERLNEHICPVCGVTMYQTGGGFTLLGKALFFVLVVPLAFILLLNLLAYPFAAVGFGKTVSQSLGFLAFVGLMYFLYKSKNKT